MTTSTHTPQQPQTLTIQSLTTLPIHDNTHLHSPTPKNTKKFPRIKKKKCLQNQVFDIIVHSIGPCRNITKLYDILPRNIIFCEQHIKTFQPNICSHCVILYKNTPFKLPTLKTIIKSDLESLYFGRVTDSNIGSCHNLKKY